MFETWEVVIGLFSVFMASLVAIVGSVRYTHKLVSDAKKDSADRFTAAVDKLDVKIRENTKDLHHRLDGFRKDYVQEKHLIVHMERIEKSIESLSRDVKAATAHFSRAGGGASTGDG